MIRTNSSFLSTNPAAWQGEPIRRNLLNRNEIEIRNPGLELRNLIQEFSSVIQREKPNTLEFHDAIDKLKRNFGSPLQNTLNRLIARFSELRESVEAFAKKLIKYSSKPLAELLSLETFKELYPAILAHLNQHLSQDGMINPDVPIELKIDEVNHSEVAPGWEVKVRTKGSRISPYLNGDPTTKKISPLLPAMEIELKSTSPTRNSKNNQISKIAFKVDDASCDIHKAYPKITNVNPDLTGKSALREMTIELMDGNKYEYKRNDTIVTREVNTSETKVPADATVS